MNELEKTYARQVDMVFKICVLHLKNIHDSEEATQETFIKFIRYNPKFENLQHEKAWFIKTASNICKNILSSSWSSKVTCLDDLSYFQEQKENYKLLQEILELPPKYKLPIYLFYYEGYSTEEISKILDMNSSTVRSNLHRGRKLLKNLLESGDRIE